MIGWITFLAGLLQTSLKFSGERRARTESKHFTFELPGGPGCLLEIKKPNWVSPTREDPPTAGHKSAWLEEGGRAHVHQRVPNWVFCWESTLFYGLNSKTTKLTILSPQQKTDTPTKGCALPQIGQPAGLAFDARSGRLLVADRSNHVLRSLDLRLGRGEGGEPVVRVDQEDLQRF